MAGHSAQESRRLVVDVAAQVLPAEEVVERRGHDVRLRVALQGQEEGALQTHRGVELFIQVQVHGQLGDVLHHLLQQDEAQVAVHVAFALEPGTGNGAQHVVLEVLVQPHALGYGQGVGGALLVGHHAPLELEVRTIVTVLAHLRLVPLVLPTLGIRAVHRMGVDGIHIEADVGRQTGLMEQQLADDDVALVRAPQEGKVLGGLVVQLQLAFIVQLHHGKQRSRGLGQRGEVEHVGSPYPGAVHRRVHAKALVVHRMAVFQYQDAATRVGACLQSLQGHLVDALQHVRLHAVIIGHQRPGLHARHNVAPRTCGKQPPDTHGQPSIGSGLTEQHLCHMSLYIGLGRMGQHHRTGLLQSRRKQRQWPVRRKAGIYHRCRKVQIGQESYIVITNIGETCQTDYHAIITHQGLTHLGPHIAIGIPRQTVNIGHTLLLHGQHEGGVFGLLPAHAEHGNLSAAGCQRQYIEVVVEHGDRRFAQPGSQVAGFLRIDAMAKAAYLQLALLAPQAKQVFIRQHLPAFLIDKCFG